MAYPKSLKERGRPPKAKSREDLQKKIDIYFKEIEKGERPPTMTGLAIACGFNRNTLINYARSDQYGDIICEARSRIQLWLEEELAKRNGNVTGLIFSLKNNFGWEDAKKVDASVDGGIQVTINRNVKS